MVELLAPSGNFECVKAAVCNGADAIYLGGKLFNARAYANNFDKEELEKVCDYCHSYGVKVYVTVNTLYKNEEFEELMPFIDELYVMGVDALIMQDLGAISLVRKNWPDFPVHASTQLTANSIKDVNEFEEIGLSTVVLSRELNLGEIRDIVSNTSMNVEVFIHGALCVSYSGQCFMSGVLGKRSGNRGKCAQNCRLNYQLKKDGETLADGHLLSPKDICTLDVLPQLLDSGVASLKIEGRMKSAEYVAGVTAIYRKYIDMYYEDKENYKVDKMDRLILQQLFNRGGFSEGYFRTHSGNIMMCPVHPKNWGVYLGTVKDYKNGIATIDINKDLNNGDGIEIWTDDEEGVGCYINKPCHIGINKLKIKGDIKVGTKVYQTYDKELFDELSATLNKERFKVSVAGKIDLHVGENSRLDITNGDITVSVENDVVQQALSQPLSDELIYEQISKMGNTSFELVQLEIYKDDSCYVNKKILNALRNEACERLLEKIVSSKKRRSQKYEFDQPTYPQASIQEVSVTVRNLEQFETVVESEKVSLINFEYHEGMEKEISSLVKRAHQSNKQLNLKLPRIWRKYIYDKIDLAKFKEVEGFLISCLGHLNSVKDLGKKLYLDYTGNVLNDHSFNFWIEKGLDIVSMSLESSANEMVENDHSEILGYGQLPLMVTHQCPIGNYVGHKTKDMYCDRYNHGESYKLVSNTNEFDLVTDCGNCLCTIYGKAIDETAATKKFSSRFIRYDFVNETGQEVNKILNSNNSNGYFEKGLL